MNSIHIIGRLGRDPELRYTQAGKAVASFSVAVDRRQKGETDWFNVSAWEKTAELCNEYLRKGRQVAVRGRMQSRQYEKDGAKVTAWDLVAEEVQFIGPREEESAPAPAPAPVQKQAPRKPTGRQAVELMAPSQVDLDDVPF